MIGLRSRSWFFYLAVTAGLALSAGTASAELVAKLPEVLNPFFLTIADGRMYIVENSVAAHIYTLDPKGVAFVKTFGREGQGPGEFDFMYMIRAFKDHLDIPGSYKLARFSLAGDYISEVAVTVGAFKGAFYRLGAGYVVRNFNFDEKGATATIHLYDKDFKLVKEIGTRTTSGGLTKINLVMDYYAPRVAGDELYVIDAARDSVVTVYDRNGVERKKIRLPLEPVKMTAALKEAVIKPIKEGWTGVVRWEDYEKRLFFPDQTPGLDYFEIVDGRFVTRTYKYRQDKVEFAIFDRQGRELRRLDLPFTGRLSNGILFCFYQGRYFYLRENAEEEVWELHAEKAW
ncbi:MAG: 6-bladed beta-propeller [Candidatus Aminicenantales bacterium]